MAPSLVDGHGTFLVRVLEPFSEGGHGTFLVREPEPF